MTADAIQRVSEAIAHLIEEALPSAGSLPRKILLGPPTALSALEAQVVLYPIQVTTVADPRNRERERPPRAGIGEPDARSIAVEVRYLLTIGATSAPTTDATVWLGHAILALHQAPVLIGPAEGRSVQVTQEAVTIETLTGIWAMFPKTEFRTSVIYRASPIWLDPVPVGG